MKTVSIKPLVLVAASLVLFGCASSELKELHGELDQVRATADKAAADAAAAQSRADAAMDTAAAAKEQSEETEAKIDRMFKKAMYK